MLPLAGHRRSRVCELASRIKITELGELELSLKDTQSDCLRKCVGRITCIRERSKLRFY